MTERFPTDNELQCAWDDYLEASACAKRSLQIEDAIIAGKLWGKFMRMAANHVPTKADGNVIHVGRFQERVPNIGRGKRWQAESSQ